MEKLKKIAKYTTNILAIVSALVAGINAVDGITIPDSNSTNNSCYSRCYWYIFARSKSCYK